MYDHKMHFSKSVLKTSFDLDKVLKFSLLSFLTGLHWALFSKIHYLFLITPLTAYSLFLLSRPSSGTRTGWNFDLN